MERPDGKRYQPMTRWVVDHIGKTYGVQPEFLWARTPNYGTFRHPGKGKWFAVLMMELPRERLGLDQPGSCDILNLKCDPVVKGTLVDGRHIFPGYHMNKEHWISVILDEGLPTDTLTVLIDMSYAGIDWKKRC